MKMSTKLIVCACLLTLACACQQAPIPSNARGVPSQAKKRKTPITTEPRSEAYGPPAKLADLEEPAVGESSGIAASRTSPGLYWTHNDSDNGPFIYAFDDKGKRRGVWRVSGATSRDWEDIATGPGPKANTSYLYIGDTGNNSGTRTDVIVYRVAEPTIDASSAASSKLRPLATEAAEAIHLQYTDGAHDSEALLVHPSNGKVYLLTKVAFENPSVYEADLSTASETPINLKRIGELAIHSIFGGIITGGAVSPDGRRVALCDLFQGYELVLTDPNASFDDIWKQKLTTIWLGKRKQGEAITYRLDGMALLVTSEGFPAPLIQVERK
jgi:hypothetical protein